jgi:LacI family transcriptional regulator
MSTLEEVAEIAGVSRTTVSRYLNSNGYVGEDTAKKIEKAIRTLDYYPNQIARSLVRKKTGNIALVVSNIFNPITAGYSQGFEDEAFQYGYNVVLCNTNFDPEREKKVVKILLEKQIDGIIIAPCQKQRDHIIEIKKRGIPLVFLTRRIPDIEADYVRFDYVKGSFQVVEYLIQLGHRRIGIISPPVLSEENEERIHGYLKAFQEYNLNVDPSLIFYGKAVEGVGYEKAKMFMTMSKPPTALFTAVNLFAKDVLLYCKQNQIDVPHELSLSSFECFPHYDSIINPLITANEMPAHELGRIAAECLFLRKNQKNGEYKSIALPGKLRIGDSTQPLNKS